MAAISWFWKNIFIIGIISIENSLCIAQARRKWAPLKWAAFTVVMLLASTFLTETWRWTGNLIDWQNIVVNTGWRIVLVIVSAAQIWTCFKLDVWNAVFISQIAAACQTAQFSFYKLVEALALGEQAQRSPGVPSILLNLAVLIISCLIVYFLFGRNDRLSFRLDRYNIYVILLAAFLNVAGHGLNAILYATDSNANFGIPLIVMRMDSLLFNCVTIYMLYNLITRRSIEIEQKTIRNIMRERERQYHFTKELIDGINIKSHDLKKLIRYLRSAGTENEDLMLEIENLTSSYDATIHTENAALTAVLTEKSLSCQKNKIPFTFMGTGAGLDFMRGLDIYTLFANLLDNAIEASLFLEPEKRSIHLVIDRQFDLLSIHCVNNFSGTIREREGELLTIKEDNREHGFGYKSMEAIVTKYDGCIDRKTEESTFVVNILFPIPPDK